MHPLHINLPNLHTLITNYDSHLNFFNSHHEILVRKTQAVPTGCHFGKGATAAANPLSLKCIIRQSVIRMFSER